MSIVGKAIDKASGKGHKRSRRPRISPHDARKGRDASEDRADNDIVEVLHLADRGLLSVLENDDLSRAFRFLKRTILAKLFPRSRPEPEAAQVIMITSAMPGAGKSFTGFNIAASIAREQLLNVILIDADTVRHSLTSTLRSTHRQGLLEALETRESELAALPTDLPGLQFIPCGQTRENAPELLASESMADLLATLGDRDTVIVLDTTPLLVSSEADAMSAHADHIFLVIEAGNTSSDEIKNSLQMLEKSGAPVSLIMNKLKAVNVFSDPAYYYTDY